MLFPHPLKSLLGIPLAQITAGGDHSFALSLSGAVFGWGKNRAGQLGLNDEQGNEELDRKKPLEYQSQMLKLPWQLICTKYIKPCRTV